tara:strand:- start:3785 stop:4516 length:732 start_codon:yes stop_codon:yes gene_type:complete
MNTHNMFELLEKYSLNSHNIHNLITNEYFEYKPSIKKKQIVIKHNKNNDFFVPEEKDGLFWCWFIFKYGFSEYEILKQNSFSVEKEYKINFVKKVRENKKFLKNMKIKSAEMEGNLANDTLLKLLFLEPMLLIEKFNFIYMDDKIYYENIANPGKKNCIIKYFKNEEKYGLFLDDKNKQSKLFEYREKLFIVDSFTKPIKGISNYKAQQIKDICKKLKIDIMKTPTKSKTKKELYQLVIEKLL